jgi:hypothetical protein
MWSRILSSLVRRLFWIKLGKNYSPGIVECAVNFQLSGWFLGTFTCIKALWEDCLARIKSKRTKLSFHKHGWKRMSHVCVAFNSWEGKEMSVKEKKKVNF